MSADDFQWSAREILPFIHKKASFQRLETPKVLKGLWLFVLFVSQILIFVFCEHLIVTSNTTRKIKSLLSGKFRVSFCLHTNIITTRGFVCELINFVLESGNGRDELLWFIAVEWIANSLWQYIMRLLVHLVMFLVYIQRAIHPRIVAISGYKLVWIS